MLQVRNGGDIHLAFTDLLTQETLVSDNLSTGEYAAPLKPGSKVKLQIIARKAIGAYPMPRSTLWKAEDLSQAPIPLKGLIV
ncbi:MAG: hypothetical protein IJ787_03320 [Bacilli bacterium]|nr:hypothetical protein [Bacilli bacterium]